MSKPFTPVTCKLCGHVDKSTKTHIGTSVMMRCSDCCTEAEPYATLCRRCCPTNHGTHTHTHTHEGARRMLKLCGSCKHWQKESNTPDGKKLCEALSYQTSWENGYKHSEDYEASEDRTPLFEIMNTGSSPGPSQVWTSVNFHCGFWKEPAE